MTELLLDFIVISLTLQLLYVAEALRLGQDISISW